MTLRSSLASVICVLFSSLLVIHTITALPASPISSVLDQNINAKPPKKLKQDDSDVGDVDTDAGLLSGIVELGSDPDNPASAQYLYGTYTNIGTILSGVVGGNISNVLQGGTNFIPPGNLRNSLNFLLQQAVVPSVQKVITDVGQNLQSIRSEDEVTTPISGFIAAPAAVVPSGPDTFRSPNQPRLDSLPQSINIDGNSKNASEGGFFNNPIKALQNRLQGLQGLIPSFNFGANKNSNTNANADNNANSVNQNRYRQNIPVSPVG